MNSRDTVNRRFQELEKQMQELKKTPVGGGGITWYAPEHWQAWATSVLSLFDSAFGRSSVHFEIFARLHEGKRGDVDVDAAKGVFQAAKSDWEGGYVLSLERTVSGEIFADLVTLAKEALSYDNQPAAAVLACAALEDALKRFAVSKGLDVSDKVMQQVVAALKSKGLVSGAQKSLLDAMPKIRDHAMHAQWEKITPADTASVIAFVEQFLLAHF